MGRGGESSQHRRAQGLELRKGLQKKQAALISLSGRRKRGGGGLHKEKTFPTRKEKKRKGGRPLRIRKIIRGDATRITYRIAVARQRAPYPEKRRKGRIRKNGPKDEEKKGTGGLALFDWAPPCPRKSFPEPVRSKSCLLFPLYRRTASCALKGSRKRADPSGTRGRTGEVLVAYSQRASLSPRRRDIYYGFPKERKGGQGEGGKKIWTKKKKGECKREICEGRSEKWLEERSRGRKYSAPEGGGEEEDRARKRKS